MINNTENKAEKKSGQGGNKKKGEIGLNQTKNKCKNLLNNIPTGHECNTSVKMQT